MDDGWMPEVVSSPLQSEEKLSCPVCRYDRCLVAAQPRCRRDRQRVGGERAVDAAEGKQPSRPASEQQEEYLCSSRDAPARDGRSSCSVYSLASPFILFYFSFSLLAIFLLFRRLSFFFLPGDGGGTEMGWLGREARVKSKAGRDGEKPFFCWDSNLFDRPL